MISFHCLPHAYKTVHFRINFTIKNRKFRPRNSKNFHFKVAIIYRKVACKSRPTTKKPQKELYNDMLINWQYFASELLFFWTILIGLWWVDFWRIVCVIWLLIFIMILWISSQEIIEKFQCKNKNLFCYVSI